MYRFRRRLLSDEAWHVLTFGVPRRKYAPEHWYSTVYFAGVSLGWRCRDLWQTAYRPVALFCKGFVQPWRDDE